MRAESIRWPAAAAFILASIAAAGAAPAGKSAKRYSVTPVVGLEDPACEPGFQRSVYARRLNEAGTVVGYDDCFVATGDPEAPYLPRGVRSFRWTTSTGPVALPAYDPQALDILARDVNDHGVAVGYEFPLDVVARGLSWPVGGGVAPVFSASSCSFAFSRAEAVNNRGSIAGSDYRLNELGGCSSRWMLKLPTGEEIEGPGGTPFDMNNNDVLVGDSGLDIVRWSPATGVQTLYHSPGGMVSAQGWSINDRNEAVGEVVEYDGATGCIVRNEAKFWAADGSERTLPMLQRGLGATAFGVNNRGRVVGNVQVAPVCDTADVSDADDVAALRAVTWVDGEITNLNSRVPKAFAREYILTYATGVNDRGQITVRAIRRGEPEVRCPIWDYDFPTGEEFYNAARTCLNEYAFLLTPVE